MSNWWATKLGTPEPTYAPAPAPRAPAYVPPPQAPVAPSRAPSDRGDACPECRSGNYFSGSPSTRARCYDCGYPITQSSSGVNTLVRPAGDIQDTNYESTKQINTHSNYNPHQIVDRI